MSEFYAFICGGLVGGFIAFYLTKLFYQPEKHKQKLERNTEYKINDEELFLFATNGFWDREERMEYYRRIKARKIDLPVTKVPE